MSGEDPMRFVADGGHGRAAMEELSAVLDRYDRRRARLREQMPTESDAVVEREQFALDYSAWREEALRAALEEVVWMLEQRGHHAWLDDVGADETPASLGASRERSAVARPLVLRVAPAHVTGELSTAAQLRIVPDSAVRRVHIEAIFGEPGSVEPSVVSVPLRLEDVTDRFITDAAVSFIREVLFEGEVEQGATEAEAADLGPHQPDRLDQLGPLPPEGVGDDQAPRRAEWSETGIAERWRAHQRRHRMERKLR